MQVAGTSHIALTTLAEPPWLFMEPIRPTFAGKFVRADLIKNVAQRSCSK
jgi:hypothetical protein